MIREWTGIGGAALALLACLLCAADATGQGIRSGFWMEGTLGTGTVRNTCAGCPGVTVGFGSTSALRVGGALNRRVLVGMEALWLESPDVTLGPGVSPVEAEHLTLVPVVMWYVGGSGFFLKAGAGLARVTFTQDIGPDAGSVTKKTGTGLTFAVGFDVAVVRWFALTASLGTSVTAIGDLDVNGQLVDDAIATVYEAGIGLALR